MNIHLIHSSKILLLGLVVGALIYYNHSLKEDDAFDSVEFADSLIQAGFETSVDPVEATLLAERTIVMTTDVNENSSRSIIRRLLLLEARNPGAPIDLYLRTEGGWEADAFAIIAAINAITSPVNIHAFGEVHSAGVMILSAGTGDRIVYPDTLLGYHALDGDEDELFRDRYINLFKKHAKLPPEWLARADGELEFFDAPRAISLGIADRLSIPSLPNRKEPIRIEAKKPAKN